MPCPQTIQIYLSASDPRGMRVAEFLIYQGNKNGQR
jgi:hypothetical protein